MGACCEGGSGGAKPLFDAEHLKTNPKGIVLSDEEMEGFVKTEEGYQTFLLRHKATEKEIPKVIKKYKKDMAIAKQELKKQGMGGFAGMLDLFDEKMIKQGLNLGLEGMKADVKAQRELYKRDPAAWEAGQKAKKEETEKKQAEINKMAEDMMAGDFNMEDHLKKMGIDMKDMNLDQIENPINNNS